jgi:predicted transcriptional regulator
MGRRFAVAMLRAQAGEDFEERHLTFLSLEEMMAALTPKRLELLRYLRQHEVSCVRALALCRDYKRVHEDVKHLETTGLVTREKGRIAAPWAALCVEVAL